MNLLIMLLVQRRFVAKERIRTILYPDASPDAFEKMFERDKDELRSLGVPIEVGQIDPLFEDEPGYRIPPDRFALPEIELAPDEAAVVGLASRVWQHQRMARVTSEAVRKLSAAGVEIDTSALDIAEPRLAADEPTFDVFFDAIVERREVTFEYRRAGSATTTRRRLQPWGVTRYAGRWYVTGYDLDRADERLFRLSRVEGEARKVGRSGAYEIPEDVDISEVARRLAPAPASETIVVLARAGSAIPLRTEAATIEPDVNGPDTHTTWDRLTLTRSRSGLGDEVAGLSPNLYVESPEWLRDQVVDRLRGGRERQLNLGGAQ